MNRSEWRLGAGVLSEYPSFDTTTEEDERWCLANRARCWFELGCLENALSDFRRATRDLSAQSEAQCYEAFGSSCCTALLDTLLQLGELDDAERVLGMKLQVLEAEERLARVVRVRSMRKQLQSPGFLDPEELPVVEFCIGVAPRGSGAGMVAIRQLDKGALVAACKPEFLYDEEVELLPELLSACISRGAAREKLSLIAGSLPGVDANESRDLYGVAAPHLLESRVGTRGSGLWMTELMFRHSCTPKLVATQQSNGWRLYHTTAKILIGEEVTFGSRESLRLVPRFQRRFHSGVGYDGECERCVVECRFEERNKGELEELMGSSRLWSTQAAVELEEIFKADVEFTSDPGVADLLRAAYFPLYMLHYLLPPEQHLMARAEYRSTLLRAGVKASQLQGTRFDAQESEGVEALGFPGAVGE